MKYCIIDEVLLCWLSYEWFASGGNNIQGEICMKMVLKLQTYINNGTDFFIGSMSYEVAVVRVWVPCGFNARRSQARWLMLDFRLPQSRSRGTSSEVDESGLRRMALVVCSNTACGRFEQDSRSLRDEGVGTRMEIQVNRGSYAWSLCVSLLVFVDS